MNTVIVKLSKTAAAASNLTVDVVGIVNPTAATDASYSVFITDYNSSVTNSRDKALYVY